MLDYKKYGFKLQSEDRGLFTYLAKVNQQDIELKVLGETHTLRIVTGSKNIMVANRYKVNKQELLDFLIFGGRCSLLFMPLSASNQIG